MVWLDICNFAARRTGVGSILEAPTKYVCWGRRTRTLLRGHSILKKLRSYEKSDRPGLATQQDLQELPRLSHMPVRRLRRHWSYWRRGADAQRNLSVCPIPETNREVQFHPEVAAKI